MIKLYVVIAFSFFLTAFKPVLAAIKITDAKRQLIEVNLPTTIPNQEGMVLSQEIDLPDFKQGVYYRPFTREGRGFIARGNRVEAVAFNNIRELVNYQPSQTRDAHINVQQGQFMLLELLDGRYLAVLPMTSDKVYGQFFIEQNKVIIKTGNFGSQAVSGKIPLLIWAYGDSPYAATEAVWQQVFASGYVAAEPREFKNYPQEPYGYLGWCSWEHYKTKISQTVITDAFKTLEKSDAPFRWVMVDDGYLDQKRGQLLSFGVDKKKFPNGWQPIMDLKKSETIKWVGIWRNFGGYMNGVSPEHTMQDLKPYLTPVKRANTVLPDGTAEGAKAFYDKMIADTKNNGFDFIKVDFHTHTFDLYKGSLDPVGAMRQNNEALENATHKMNVPLLNCIAQPNINSLQTKYSALTRSSPDYNQKDKNKNKSNTYQSFANHLWMNQTVWGDLDMFHTHDKRDVQPMAIARAISGGPVYISDEPSKVKSDVLIPFAYEDGKLLRTSAPATLLPESFFIHPFRDDNVFRVIAPMNNNVAAIALFNFAESGKTLSSQFSAKDYPYAGELLKPNNGPWSLPDEGLLVYDPQSKSVSGLASVHSTQIDNFSAKLFFLYPKNKGWAVIGRSDKYLPGAAVSINEITQKRITFYLEESGPLLVWSESGTPIMNDAKFTSLGGGLYQAELDIRPGRQLLTITR
ncbi:Sip1-related alpha-galactosidase [Gayadomonas joobiniege]|uniref:Sip1-related alpha-galactosidase n=1 Tax=Gayadomonas joobiniege TaxID=1234606 RepID=UPI00036FC83F|nr:Sip1-related alpha-galactosidase [Gayadomonas joobiniege]